MTENPPWSKLLPLLGLLGIGTSGAITGLDFMGVEALQRNNAILRDELDEAQADRKEDLNTCVMQCREEIGRLAESRDWFRVRCGGKRNGMDQ